MKKQSNTPIAEPSPIRTVHVAKILWYEWIITFVSGVIVALVAIALTGGIRDFAKQTSYEWKIKSLSSEIAELREKLNEAPNEKMKRDLAWATSRVQLFEAALKSSSQELDAVKAEKASACDIDATWSDAFKTFANLAVHGKLKFVDETKPWVLSNAYLHQGVIIGASIYFNGTNATVDGCAVWGHDRFMDPVKRVANGQPPIDWPK